VFFEGDTSAGSTASAEEAVILREMLVGGRMIEGGGCGFNPKAPRHTVYPAGSNAPGALHFGIDLAQPSDYIRRVMPDWEEPPVHMDLITLDGTVTAGDNLIKDRLSCARCATRQVVAMARALWRPGGIAGSPGALGGCREYREHAGIAVEVMARDLTAGKKTDQRHIAQRAPHDLHLGAGRAEVRPAAA
jgi:hypothetical protein